LATFGRLKERVKVSPKKIQGDQLSDPGSQALDIFCPVPEVTGHGACKPNQLCIYKRS